MSVTPDGRPPGDATYIRGGGGVDMNPRLLAAVLAWVGVAVLAAFAAYYAVSGSQRSSNLSELRAKGVPVEATVKGCVAIGSGVGMGIEYWQCNASYTLAGSAFTERLNGSRAFIENGQTIAAVAVPGDPSLLSTAASVRGGHSSTGDYVASTVSGVVAASSAAGLVLLRRRRNRLSAAREPAVS